MKLIYLFVSVLCVYSDWMICSARVSQLVSQSVISVAQSCSTLCDPMNRSTPGLPVHHQLPEFTQTHVHRVSDAIQRFFLLLLYLSLYPSTCQCLPHIRYSVHVEWINKQKWNMLLIKDLLFVKKISLGILLFAYLYCLAVNCSVIFRYLSISSF